MFFVKKEIHDHEKFENFFDYEEDLLSLKPSNELYNSVEEDSEVSLYNRGFDF